MIINKINEHTFDLFLKIDLIDMRARPDGEYRWIAHARDHFTRFSWTRPLKSKEAKYIASFLLELFMTSGAPKILHSDNGKEFVAQIIKDLIDLYPKTMIINGHLCHPQSTGDG